MVFSSSILPREKPVILYTAEREVKREHKQIGALSGSWRLVSTPISSRQQRY
jgi:hypothetical protein